MGWQLYLYLGIVETFFVCLLVVCWRKRVVVTRGRARYRRDEEPFAYWLWMGFWAFAALSFGVISWQVLM